MIAENNGVFDMFGGVDKFIGRQGGGGHWARIRGTELMKKSRIVVWLSLCFSLPAKECKFVEL